jgi:hypothetical protein
MYTGMYMTVNQQTRRENTEISSCTLLSVRDFFYFDLARTPYHREIDGTFYTTYIRRSRAGKVKEEGLLSAMGAKRRDGRDIQVK